MFASRIKAVIAVLALSCIATACTVVDVPTLIGRPRIVPRVDMPLTPVQLFRSFSSVGYSNFHREYGFVRVTVDFADDLFRSVTIESFDTLGLPKDGYFDYEPHQQALGLNQRLRSLGPSRIAELDAVTGATVTSQAVRQAATRATERARVEKPSTATFYDGVFMATSDRAMRGWTIAIVTIVNDRIDHVLLQGVRPATYIMADGNISELRDPQGNLVYEVVGPEYPRPEFHHAIQTLERRFVVAGASNLHMVDTIARATVTSSEARVAVERALDMARR